MQDLIGKMYDNIVATSDDSIALGKRLDEVVEETIAPLHETMGEDEVETIKEMIYEILYVAEKDGFRLGVYTALKFMSEGMNITIEI